MDGIINLYKPAGMTSFQCVAAVKRIFKIKKVGHAGTLDPEATGVLPICIGKATKLAELFLCCPKSYRGKVLFGIATDTQDVWGQTLETGDASGLTDETVQKAAEKFHGDIEQIPPAFSAIKVNGQPLYKKAFAGEAVEVPARKVHIYDFKVSSLRGTDLDGADIEGVPGSREAVVETTCSRGTYVRTLCCDLGKAVGVPSCMSELCRTSYGPLNLADAVTLDRLNAGTDLEDFIIPVEYILHNFAAIELTDIQLSRFIHGQQTSVSQRQLKIPVRDFLYPKAQSNQACAFYSGQLVAVVLMEKYSNDNSRFFIKSWKFFGGPEVNANS